MKFSDKELRCAAISVCQSMLVGLEERAELEAGCLAVTYRFERRIKRLIHKKIFWRGFSQLAEQTAAVLLIAAMSAGLWLSLNREAWASFSGWIREVYENSYVYQYFNPDTGAFLGDYEVTGLPEEYEREVILQGEEMCIKKYQSDEGELLLTCFRTNDDIKIFVDMMDGITVETAEINGFNGDYYIYDNPKFASELIWVDVAKNITFRLSGFFDKEKMIALAESIKAEK